MNIQRDVLYRGQIQWFILEVAVTRGAKEERWLYKRELMISRQLSLNRKTSYTNPKQTVYMGSESMKLKPSEVSEDTYRLLSLLKVKLETIRISATVEKHKAALLWVAERGYKKAELTAFSGEADPRIWNAIEPELREALNQGMKYTHIIGPVVCTDENGKNAVLQLRKDYPNSTKIYLTRTRKPYHWARFTSRINGTGDLFFRLFGECRHEPLADTRKGYTICLEKKDDAFLPEKMTYWYNRNRDYLWLMPIMDEITSVDAVATLTISQLKTVCERMKKEGLEFDLETSETITSFLTNA